MWFLWLQKTAQTQKFWFSEKKLSKNGHKIVTADPIDIILLPKNYKKQGPKSKISVFRKKLSKNGYKIVTADHIDIILVAK